MKDAFHAALERTPGERPAFLEQACAGDDALRADVESLLDSHEGGAEFLEVPAFAGMVGAPAEPTPAGGRVGPYRLLREIGRGGMGAVYLAERDDGEFKHQVAVKLVKRGMDTDMILRRFRHERQILAELDHPYIARLLDGGTTADGLPYFVMEYIEGEPIDRYCASRGLSVAKRLALFRDVCAAVHYAHQRLVVHRDIKPSNILVTTGGTPKLLDFGIAKLLATPDAQATAPTATTVRAMTPEYASPEQARGEPATTLTDVFSLGVVLHELLTGRRPHALPGAPDDRSRAVGESPAERSSEMAADGNPKTRLKTERVSRPLRGDLDNIVLMATRAEPARRYASAAQLSDDLRRHLAGLPVLARPDTLAYRAGKFVRRNRAGVAAGVLVAAALVGSAAATTWNARVASAERARAERRFEEVRQLATSFLFDLHDAIRDLPGSTRARELLVKQALASFDALAREAAGDASLQRDLAAAYLRVGDVQGLPYTPNLGQTEGALASYRKALALLEPLSRQERSDRGVRRDVSVAHQRIGIVLLRGGDRVAAAQSHRRAVAVAEALVAEAPGTTEYRHLLARNYLVLGRVALQSRRLDDLREALRLFERSLAIREPLGTAAPADPALRVTIPTVFESIAYAHWGIGDASSDTASYHAALASLLRAHAMRRALLAADPTSASARRSVIDGTREIGELQTRLGDARGATASFRTALAGFEQLASADPTNIEARRDIALAHQGLSAALAQAGNLGEALAHAHSTLSRLERLHAADPTNGEGFQHLVLSHAALGRLLARSGDAPAALASYRAALSLGERLDAPGHLLPADLARLYDDFADALASSRDLEGALHGRLQGARLRETVVDSDPENAAARRALATEYTAVGHLAARLAARRLASAEERARAAGQARTAYERSLHIWDELGARRELRPADATLRAAVVRDLAQARAAKY